MIDGGVILLMPADERYQIAQWVRERRKKLGISLKRLAEKAGISRSHLYAIEEATIRPTVETLFRLADALMASREEVLELLGMKPMTNQRYILSPLSDAQVSMNPPIPALLQPVAVVPCGKPIEIGDLPEPLGFIPIHEDEMRYGAKFAVRAEGDSMLPEIKHGDFLLIRPQNYASDGDIILVSIETESGWESMVKRYRVKNEKVILESLNSAYPSIEISPQMRMHIVGKVVELKRFFK